jgi:DNA-binding transcriptional regulator LsrR (DeoR family)
MPKPSKIKVLGISKDQLIEILKNCTRKDICEHFKISERTLDRIIKDNHLTKLNYGPKNLSMQTISDIRNLHQTGKYKQKDIASKFNISQSLVSKIVNNQVHKGPKCLKVSGQASVKVGYKYGN